MSDHAHIRALAVDDLYPAALELFRTAPAGRVLDVPAGQGAFAAELLSLGHTEIHCMDINGDAFKLADERVQFTQHDVARRLPFPDAYFDHVCSVEGIEHFDSPWEFVMELCRVLKPGGRLLMTTPNTMSVDARLKYLLSGYFPRFRPLMLEPDKVMRQQVDDAHVSPIYFWQLKFFLARGGVTIDRVSTNAVVRKRRWAARAFENWLAKLIRGNMRRRGFPDNGVTSDAMLFGDILILDGRKDSAS